MTVERALPTDPATSTEVSVIVPHFRDYVRLDRCLSALQAQRFSRPYEIIVADNNSPEGLDHVRAVVAGRARVVVETEPGAGPARNRGVAAADGQILAFTDADCLPDRDWLAAGTALVTTDTIVGGKVAVLTRSPDHKSPTEAFEVVFAFDNEAYVRDKSFTVTANLFVARHTFARVGPFPTGVSEDIEWCWRARDAGIGLAYAPGAIVGHPARHDTRELEAKWRRLSHELFLLDFGRGKSVARIVARTWLMLLAAPFGILRIIRSPLLAGPGERLGAAAAMVGNRWFRFVATHRIALEHVRKRGHNINLATAPPPPHGIP